jgi:hypothetical protein
MDVDERGDVGRWHSAVVARGTFDDRVTIDAEAVADHDAAMTERVAAPLISIILQGAPPEIPRRGWTGSPRTGLASWPISCTARSWLRPTGSTGSRRPEPYA